MSVYSESELKKLHELTLEMAKYYVDFCNSNDLLCYFCGGGCIGAIRNKGFIPWDDDLDFFMPRNDYEKLKALWNNADHHRYKIAYTTEKYKDKNMFVTIRDAETTYVKQYQKDLDIVHGIVLDIFPLDGCPKGKIRRKIQMIESVVAILMCTEIIPESHGKILKYGSKLALAVIPKKKRFNVFSRLEKAMSKYRIDDSEYVTELYAGPKYMRNEYKKDLFSSAVFVDFEGEKMPIPYGYDGYLRQAFGDYMKLPPENQRIAHHDFLFMDLDRSYLKTSFNGDNNE
ncbi:MAG: LicD family protein [Bacilli bacterium]